MKIAIDGLSATGKTACSKLLAKKLNYKVFNTGNLYRMVSLRLISNDVDPEDINSIERVLKTTKLSIKNDRYYVNNLDVTEVLEQDLVALTVTKYSAVEVVKEFIRKYQKAFIEENENIIMEGRDISERIMPDADFKFYFYADINTRTKILSKKRPDISLEEVKKELLSRDEYDIKTSNFVKPKDAIAINIYNKDENEILQIMLDHLKM